MPRRILVTSALPYANGQIHIGHLVEYLQTDIWVRFQKMLGHECRYFCADDTHGTAIMIRARQERTTEVDLISRMSQEHQRDFAGFGIEFDHYGSTHSPSNERLCGEFWQALRKQGLIEERDVTQLFDAQEGVFLADRFVKGTCPRCGADDQYGDNCERCGASYSPSDLVNPVSTLSGTTPELQSAPHLFVRLEDHHAFLDQWTSEPGHLQPEIANYLHGFFLNNPLRDWDVSRPAPYFGFEIPDSPGHYWYVWFDAPIGYISSTSDWCEKTGDSVDRWWKSEQTEIVHVIGKDIVYFHTLFWPAMLKSTGYSLPRRVQVHGFLTVNGEKMSKSRGTFVSAATYLQHLDPAYLRYYYATKLNGGADDLDLDLDDFAQKVNSDLVGKLVNLASRSSRFIQDSGLSATYPDDGGLFERAAAAGAEIAEAYEAFDYAKAMRLVMALADRANEYVDRAEPWKLAKDPTRHVEVQNVCTVCLNLFRQLAVYLAPVLPQLAKQSAVLLGASIASWSDAEHPTLGHPIGAFKHLMQRVDPGRVAAMIDASTERSSADTSPDTAPPDTDVQSPSQRDSLQGVDSSQDTLREGGALDDGAALAAEPLAPECSIDDFSKVDLRVARVLVAEEVPEAKKLLKLTLSLGGGVTRTVFAGIKAAYTPAELQGRLVVMVANLKPRQMKFGTSEGMVVAAGAGGSEVFLLSPDSGAKVGHRVH